MRGRPLHYAVIVAALILAPACGGGTNEPSIAAVVAAAEKYRDVNVAIADGYTTDHKCTTAEMLGFPKEQGAMGLHYVRKDLLGIGPPAAGRVTGTGTYTDFMKPAMLVYEPQANGSLELVAVENLVFHSAWHAGGRKEPPSFRGTPYVLLRDDPRTKLDEAHNYEPHYERHIWLRPNPIGQFAEFNPNVTCAHSKSPAAAPHAGHAATAADGIPTIAPDRARELVQAGAVLVDVREVEELSQSGWLAGAKNIPTSIFAARAATLPKDKPIVLYCRSGRRSEMAARLLRARGHGQVFNLGAFDAAAAAGWPTSQGESV